MSYPIAFQKTAKNFTELPSIGQKNAERIVYYLIKNKEDLINLKNSLSSLAECHFCKRCFNLTDQAGLCSICKDPTRDQKTICIVEDLLDLSAFEQKNIFKGVYHVLGGTIRVNFKTISHKLTINSLINRIQQEKPKEIILATNPTTAGDFTASFIREELKKIPQIKITRLGRGLPTGGDLEYIDKESLIGALEGRRVL